jgi:aspartate/methionine/tyrosine aminotransferase
LKSHLDYGLPLPIQHAAAAALTADPQMVRDIVERYEARLRALEAGLTRIGWEIASPDGGVCIWAKIPERFQGEGSLRFAERLLIERAVQITPGFVYGKAYDQWARFAAVAPQDTILEVVHRLSMVAPISADKEGGSGVRPLVH